MLWLFSQEPMSILKPEKMEVAADMSGSRQIATFESKFLGGFFSNQLGTDKLFLTLLPYAKKA